MQRAFLLALVCLSLPLAAVASVSVTVTTPTNGAQVSSPFTLNAHASSNYSITAWHVYLDGNTVYTAGATTSISASINGAVGTHQLVTRAWDSSGAYGSVTEQITITSGGGGGGGGGGWPSPPSNAIVFNNIDDRSNWNWCHDPGCAGGSGSGSYWMARNQSSPSRDGASTEFYNSGVWANALWWTKLGAHDSVHNFEWDFWFQVDSASQSAAQALEFDAFQFVGGYNYMMGSQCNYGSGTWDIWDEGNGHWNHTSVSCPRFSANTWHHVQWYVTTNTSTHQYQFVTLIVDGHSYNINLTRSAKNLGWSDNIGTQWQLDVNSSGRGYHEWIDAAKLTVW